MSTLFKYVLPVEETNWKFQGGGGTCFTWDYDARSEDLLKLYAEFGVLHYGDRDAQAMLDHDAQVAEEFDRLRGFSAGRNAVP